MSNIVFLNLGEGRSNELKIDGDSTWMDVADEFVYFLQGSGYQVTRADLAEHFNDEPVINFNTEDYGTGGHDDVNVMSDYNINLGDMIGTYTVDKKW